jgi:ABC-type uncharacterized transport system substrate-binding protein
LRRATSAILATIALVFTTPASAHPHVWVTYETTVMYENGTVTSIGHIWTFDDMYTAMAIQGLDANKDGTYSKDELAELTKINIDGLKDFNYFTEAKLGTDAISFKPPKDAWLEHSNGILRLHYQLPLEKPILAEADGLRISITDPTFFIAFEPEQKDALKLSAAPDGCSAQFVDPTADKTAEDAKKLGEALAQEFNGQGPDGATGAGFASAKTITVSCKKS